MVTLRINISMNMLSNLVNWVCKLAHSSCAAQRLWSSFGHLWFEHFSIPCAHNPSRGSFKRMKTKKPPWWTLTIDVSMNMLLNLMNWVCKLACSLCATQRLWSGFLKLSVRRDVGVRCDLGMFSSSKLTIFQK